MRLAACTPAPDPPGSCGNCRNARSPPPQLSPAMSRSVPTATHRSRAGPRWQAMRNAESHRDSWTGPRPSPTDGRCSAADAPAGLRPAGRTTQPAVHGCPHRDPPLAAFYKRLSDRGEQPKLALVAVMRKLVALAHALLRANRPWQASAPCTQVPTRSPRPCSLSWKSPLTSNTDAHLSLQGLHVASDRI